MIEGIEVNPKLGPEVRFIFTNNDGSVDGAKVGTVVGRVGVLDVFFIGTLVVIVGNSVGYRVGKSVGNVEGTKVGFMVGFGVGL